MSVTPAAAILEEWYAGEIGGEALFTTLAGSSSDPGQARKWRALAGLERETGRRLAAAIGKDPRPTPSPDVAEVARRRVQALASHSWPALMRWLRDIADEALAEMSRDAETLPPDLAALAAFVLDHERALIEFSRRELAGDSGRSLDPVDALLARPFS